MTFIETSLFYLLVVFLSAALARISENGKSKAGLVAAVVLLTAVGGLRAYAVGQDTLGYKEGIEYFYAYGTTMWNHTFSVPYGVFTSAVLHIWNNYSFLLVIESLITNAFFAIRLWDFRHTASLSFAMFVYAATVFPLSMCLTCQMIAVSLVFYATRFLEQKKPLLFCVWWAVGALLHTSALIGALFLIYYLFSSKSKSRSQFAAKMFASVALLFLAAYAGSRLVDRYARYSVNESSIGLMVLAQAAVLAIAYFASRETANAAPVEHNGAAQPKGNRMSLVFYALGVLASASSYVIANAGRIAYYFTVFAPVVFGGFVKGARKVKARFCLGCFLIAWFLFYTFYAYLLHTGLGIESYSFVWMG
ncbi:EpsG family protein [Senegalimassilia anaerobia]